MKSLILASLVAGLSISFAHADLTLEQANEYAQKAAAVSEIPVEMNEFVLKKLNRYVGNAEARKLTRETLARMQTYRNMIDERTTESKLPEELLAIPLVETAFQNNLVSPAPWLAKGIWQFVAETARRYGLTVSAKVDERTHPARETTAAMKYFGDLFENFQDWRLAIKAYNEGEGYLWEMIHRYGTKDAWELERNDHQSGYLASVTAAIILLKNPDLAEEPPTP